MGQHDIDEQHPWTQSDWAEEEIVIASDWIETKKSEGILPVNQLPGADWRLLRVNKEMCFYRSLHGTKQPSEQSRGEEIIQNHCRLTLMELLELESYS